MSFIYHTIVGFAILVASPLIVLRVIFSSDFRFDFFERISGYKVIKPLNSCIWVHAASVGEVRLAKTIISALKKK